MGFASLALSGSPSLQSTLSTAFVLLCGSLYNGNSGSSTVHRGACTVRMVLVLLLTLFIATLPLGYRKHFERYMTRDGNSIRFRKYVCGALLAVNSTSTNQVEFSGNVSTGISIPVTSLSNMTFSDHFLTSRGLYGRLGNRLSLLYKLVASAEANCCGVSLPTNILDGWHPLLDASTFANLDATCEARLDVNQSTCASRSKSGKDWFYFTVERQPACYKPLMQRYFGINSTHALGKKCPNLPHVVLHVRTGDVTRGSFNMTTEVWVPGSVHAEYFPFPTSYYLAALNNMTKRAVSSTTYYVLCEDSGNPTCDYFLNAALFAQINLRVRIGQPLLEDIHLLLCAEEVAVSRGTFQNIIALSTKKQIVHAFTNNPSACAGQRTSPYTYYIDDVSQQHLYSKSAVRWRNTGYQRFIVNQKYTIQTCGSVRLTRDLNSSSLTSS